MFSNFKKAIIILTIVLIIVLFNQTEHFAKETKCTSFCSNVCSKTKSLDCTFRIKLKGTTNTYLYDTYLEGFSTLLGYTSEFYYGVNNTLICYNCNSSSMNNKCLYYDNSPSTKYYTNNQYKLLKGNRNYDSKCSPSGNLLTLYFDGTYIFYINTKENVKYYLSTDKYFPNKSNQRKDMFYYKFSSDKTKALELEIVYRNSK